MIEVNFPISKAFELYKRLIKKIRHHDSLEALQHGEASDRRLMLAIN